MPPLLIKMGTLFFSDESMLPFQLGKRAEKKAGGQQGSKPGPKPGCTGMSKNTNKMGYLWYCMNPTPLHYFGVKNVT